MNVKQVIVMRTDLNMRKGKMVAQGSHASMAVLLDAMKKTEYCRDQSGYITYLRELEFLKGEPWDYWINESFVKICLKVNSEEELRSIYKKALDTKIPCSLIEDNVIIETTFAKNVLIRTITCCAIGPFWSEKIDLITGNLKLL